MPTHALKFRGLSVCVFVMNASPTKTDEPMEMPFGGGQTRVCPSDRLLDGGCTLAPLGEYDGSICTAAMRPVTVCTITAANRADS